MRLDLTNTRAFAGEASRAAALLAIAALAASAQQAPRELTEASLEELMNIEVTSVSKREQRLIGAPAAIFVITQEDIRRSGLSSLPEILRLAPGLDVAKIDGNKWAVSSRGFNAQFSKMILVLIDGRSVYLPSNSGVYWDEQETMIEDIDRIEVIRGPGATLWGANAVNGVINIITKSSGDTLGALLSVSGGNEDRSVNAARYGGRIGERGSYRIFSMYSHRQDLPRDGDRERSAPWVMKRAGFRTDWSLSDKDDLTVQGDVFDETSGLGLKIPILTPPFQEVRDHPEDTAGGNLLVNWRHRYSEESVLAIKSYFDHAEKNTLLLDEHRSTFDLDLQHYWSPVPRHEIVWGAGFRHNRTKFRNTPVVAFLPERRGESLYNVFLQDEIHVVPDRFSVTLGSKFEHNAFTGMEVQPGVRLAWTPNPQTGVWAAVSRAVRTPSYFDEGTELGLATFPSDQGIPAYLRLFGSEMGVAEILRAHEAGYRSQLGRRLSIDLAGFYNVYHHLKTWEPREPFVTANPEPLHLVIPLILANRMNGESFGLEVTGHLDITERWRVISSYSWLSLRLHLDPSSGDFVNEAIEGQSPQHQIQLRSEVDLGDRLQFDTSVYHISKLPALSVEAYTRIDARLGWRPARQLEISIGGRDLQGGLHREYISEGPFSPSRVGRSFYGKVTWQF